MPTLPRSLPRLPKVAAGLLFSSLLLGALSGCAIDPPRGTEVWVEVGRAVAPAELLRSGYSARFNVDAQRLRAAGLNEDDVRAGRLVEVACAVMSDGTWPSLGVVPAGMQVQPGQVVRLRVQEGSENHRVGLNPIVGEAQPPLRSGMPAYRAIPDWRERGLSQNFERLPLPAGQEGRFLVVQGSYVVKCR